MKRSHHPSWRSAPRAIGSVSLLAALAGTTAFAAAEQPQSNRVRLQYASFDPTIARPHVPEILRATPDNELFLVHFHGTPLQTDRDQISAWGGVVERFLTDNTHIVRMVPAVRDQVAALPQVRWVGPYEPAYRLSEDARAMLLAGLQSPTALQRGSSAPARYSIETMRQGPAQQLALADLITQIGGIVEVVTLPQYRMEATLSPEQLLTVVRRNEVNYIDPWYGPGGEDMDLIRQTGGAVPILSVAGFLGQGIRGEIFDSGINLSHQQWNGQQPLIHAATGNGSHGAACYGINFATGTGNAQATGMMPMREQGIFCLHSISTQFGGPIPRLTLNTEATDPIGPYRSVFQTSSVGSPQITNYSTISAEVDDYLFRVDYLSCQSQSNTGNRNSRPQAWAKNIMSVGGVNLGETITFDDDVRASASIGPAQDLRVKPDLSHSYGSIFTTYSTSTTGYGQFSGTSGATPITAGHYGLLHQMWHEGVWAGFGGAATVFESRPKSTTAKAMLINSAYRWPLNQTSSGTPFTNNMYRAYIGWGIADLRKLYNDRDKFFIVNANEPLAQSQIRSYPLTVAPGEPEIRVTMIYPDPQGNPAAAQQRINDLSVKVTSPSGTVYWGNNGMVPTAISGTGQLVHANYTVPGGSANTYDTVENVFVQNPEAGVWTVEVIASQIVQDGYLATTALDAVYSLVVSNVTQGEPCYANCDGSTASPILNVADFTCFLQKFAAGDPWANCDGTGVPPLNIADFTCFLAKFAAGCP
jgi:serine protease AprX